MEEIFRTIRAEIVSIFPYITEKLDVFISSLFSQNATNPCLFFGVLIVKLLLIGS